MSGELLDVFRETARILVLELHARRPVAVGGRKMRHAFFQDHLRVFARGGLKGRVLRRVRAVASARDRDGERAL